MADAPTTSHGLTVEDVSRRYRVGPDKVRAWIKSGVLKAVNTSAVLSGKPRYVVTPDSLAEFERTRSAAAPPKVVRAKRRPTQTDFFPD